MQSQNYRLNYEARKVNSFIDTLFSQYGMRVRNHHHSINNMNVHLSNATNILISITNYRHTHSTVILTTKNSINSMQNQPLVQNCQSSSNLVQHWLFVNIV